MAGRLEAGQEAGQEVRLPAVPLGVFSAAGGYVEQAVRELALTLLPATAPRCIALGRSSEPTVSPTCNTNSVISRSRTDLAEHAADYMPLLDIVARELAAACSARSVRDREITELVLQVGETVGSEDLPSAMHHGGGRGQQREGELAHRLLDVPPAAENTPSGTAGSRTSCPASCPASSRPAMRSPPVWAERGRVSEGRNTIRGWNAAGQADVARFSTCACTAAMSSARTCSMRSMRAGSGNAPGWENTRTCSRKTMRVGMDLIPAQAASSRSASVSTLAKTIWG